MQIKYKFHRNRILQATVNNVLFRYGNIQRL